LEGYNSTIMCYGQTGVLQPSGTGPAQQCTARQQQCISVSSNLEQQQQPAVYGMVPFTSIHLHLHTTIAVSVYMPNTSASNSSSIAPSYMPLQQQLC
jgi:hypothetical protein